MNSYRGKHTSSMPWADEKSSRGYRSRHTQKNRRLVLLRRLVLVLVLLVLALPFLNPLFLQTDQASLVSGDLPYDIGRLRIVFLSDIHYGFFFSQSRLNSLVTQINNLKPDLVLFGGDYATDPESAARFFRHLPSIHARYEMLGVLGETDRGKDDASLAMVADAMRAADVTPLINAVRQVRIGNSSIYVVGADEPINGSPALKTLAASVTAEDYVILLAHNPSLIPEAQNVSDKNGKLGWFDLALFGHTHGGQISFLAPLLDIGGDVDERYRSGWLQENRVDMLISNGVGTSVIPARVGCPAQIHLIEIAAQ